MMKQEVWVWWQNYKSMTIFYVALTQNVLTDYTNICIFIHGYKKPIDFRGDSRGILRTFPLDARRESGYQLDRVQSGFDPDDWKPMSTIGSGVREIRIHDVVDIYRVIYIAKFSDAVYVLHCFQKKTEKTSDMDMALATK